MEINKKVNPNTRPSKTPKKSLPPLKTYQEEYFVDLFSFGKIPVTQEYLKKFAYEWVERAHLDEDMLTLQEFAFQKGVDHSMLEDWIKRCPELGRARNLVRGIIGIRREKGALKKKLDAASVFRNQHVYCNYDKASEEWRSDMKAKNAKAGAATGPITVVMEKFQTEDIGNAQFRKVKDE